MKSCEEYEIELSSLLDRELSPAEAADAIEHALSCPGCNHFYRAARRLQAVTAITATGSTAGDDDEQLAPARAEQLWRQVRAAGAPPAAAANWQRPLRAAALVVLGLGGGYWLAGLGNGSRATVPAPPAATGTTIATANGANGAPGATLAMDEHRFVALAGELLGADVRYQRAMLEVLRLVPALETGEGLSTEDGQRGTVLTRLDHAGAI